MINTYNETTLHKTLKELYASTYKGRTEEKIKNHICDIVCNTHIIEIQTSNLAALRIKLASLLEYAKNNKIKIIVVFPIATKTTIITEDKKGKIISKRKSPKKKGLLSVYKELTGIFEVLTNPNFILEVLLIEQIEMRLKTSKPVQTPNKTRRWKKDWIKIDKSIEKITEKHIFSTPQDYIKPILPYLPKEKKIFSAPELTKAGLKQHAHVILWVLRNAGIIEEIEKNGRVKQYILQDYSL